MKLNQLIYDIRESISEYTDDSNISNRHLEYLYQIKRSKYIRQDLDKFNRSVDESIIQTYCGKLEEVPTTTCSVYLNCDTLLRTVYRVPSLIDLSTKPSIISIRPTHLLSRPFSYISNNRLSNIEGSPFSNSIYSFLDNGYIYIYSKDNDYKNLSCVEIKGVFEDPLELERYPKCCECDINDNPCFDRNTMDYPIQSRYIDLIRNEIIQEIIRKKQIPEDLENDASNIVQPPTSLRNE